MCPRTREPRWILRLWAEKPKKLALRRETRMTTGHPDFYSPHRTSSRTRVPTRFRVQRAENLANKGSRPPEPAVNAHQLRNAGGPNTASSASAHPRSSLRAAFRAEGRQRPLHAVRGSPPRRCCHAAFLVETVYPLDRGHSATANCAYSSAEPLDHHRYGRAGSSRRVESQRAALP